MHIATYIHNESLRSVCLFDYAEDALNKAIEIAERLLDRDLTDFESSTLYNEGELFIDEDHDNQYTVIFQETE
jgi:hypothetical protein